MGIISNIDILGNIDFLSVGIAIAATVIIGFSVLFGNYRSLTNRAFFYFVILAAVWGFFNLMSYRVTNNVELAFLLLKIELFLAVWYVFAIFHLFYIFPEEKSVFFPFWYKKILIPFVLLVSLLTLTPFVFSRVSSVSASGAIITLETGPAIIIFGLTVITLIVMSFWIFSRKMKNVSKEERSKFSLLLVGSVITFFLIISLIFILPAFFNNSDFVPFGAIFTLPFVVFTSYAIIRHKLFNIKVAGTGLLVFTLSIVGFIEVTQATNWVFIVYKSSVLFFILVFGVVLIREVLREVEMREKAAELAEARQRAYELEKKAKEELENLDKTKNQFILLIQHNLRTPLTSMMGYSDLLLNGSFGRINKKAAEVIKRFQVSTNRLIKMVNDFLNITQFQLGKSVVTLKPNVGSIELINEIVEDLKQEAEDKKIYLKFEKPSQVLAISADREKLKAAITNIVHNAIKYTPKGGVEINIKNQISNIKNNVLIEVKDTGIGISAENLKTIFSRIFERGEEAKKVANNGSGIGLYLAGQIINAHNGRVWAQSEGAGHGSTFYIELPIGPSADDNQKFQEPKEVLIKNL